MQINKQLFEDVLSGKLKGTFVLRNVHNIYGVELKPNHTCIQKSKEGFYIIRMPSLLFNVVDIDGKSVYACTKHKKESENNQNYDIIDFIPETNMKENELTIEIPENHEIDWQESAKQEKIVFKKKDTKPRSWEEYCKRTILGGQSYIHNNGWIETITEYNEDKMDEVSDRMVLPSKELAEAFLAMMQLMSLRQAWIGDWESDWNDTSIIKWCIVNRSNELDISLSCSAARVLSFPTCEMAKEFLDCFRNLIEIAKLLL